MNCKQIPNTLYWYHFGSLDGIEGCCGALDAQIKVVFKRSSHKMVKTVKIVAVVLKIIS